MNNKDLIKQYVDTGQLLPEHQVVQLPDWAKKTYIRKRLIAIDVSNYNFLKGYEIALLNTEQSEQYFNNYFKEYIDNMRFPNSAIHKHIQNDLKYFPEKYKTTYLDTHIAMDKPIYEKVFKILSTDDKIKFLDWNANRGLGKNSMSDIFDILSEDLKIYYLKKILSLYSREEINKKGRWKMANYYSSSPWDSIVNLLNNIENGQ